MDAKVADSYDGHSKPPPGCMVRHKNVDCKEFLCLPEKNPSHYEVVRDSTPQVIEKTSKEYKRIILGGYAIMGLGLLLCIPMMVSEATALVKVGTVAMLLLGLGVSAYGKGMAWWHHG